ncbi:MAG: mechanosensitive ion channel family protein [Myxococcota bacterium]|jgi:small-conductance mechanosensitive channel|nr:mechanosensitive ion channel family protein [Myxococcota bacterium]
MDWIPQSVYEFFDKPFVVSALRAAMILVLGLMLARFLVRLLQRLVSERFSAQHQMILRRSVFYIINGLVLFAALRELGVDLSVLLGAAGVLTVALGFASQTSASNLIAGLFMMTERAFEVGNFIKAGTSSGTVLSIDLLSVKLQTVDNLFIRIPNEMMIKTEIINYSRFPIRRMDIRLGVAYDSAIPRVREVLLAMAHAHPLILEEPEPVVGVVDFGPSELLFELRVWFARENVVELSMGLREAIKNALDQNEISIPFPHRVIINTDK